SLHLGLILASSKLLAAPGEHRETNISAQDWRTTSLEGQLMKRSTYVATGLSVRSRLRQQGPTYDRLIRLLNQFCAAILIVLTSPVMLVVAWLIWRKDGRPVLFGHYRVGQDGQLFKCLKFRSM